MHHRHPQREVRQVVERNNVLERRFEFQARAASVEGQEGQELYVEGYACRFDSPTVLFEYAGEEYKEQISRTAFDEAQMDDVIFNYNHQGKVMARTRNNTLELKVDEKGLFIRARLDGTAEGRTLYNEIAGGYIDRMSFAFSVREESFDEVAKMWTVHKVKRLYDVAAVDIPAYEDTSIEARRSSIEAAQRVRQAALDLQKRKLALKCKL